MLRALLIEDCTLCGLIPKTRLSAMEAPSYYRRMQKHDHVWHIVDIIAPDAGHEDRQEIHANMTAYLKLLYEIYCRMDGEGLLDGDSQESELNDIVGVA